MSTTDASLAARADMISLGERVTFEELYAEQYPSMLRLAHALVDTREQAEEVVQDSFAAIYERFDRLDHPAAYLRTTVVNRCSPRPPPPDAVAPASDTAR
ncbi:MAG: sigma factor [Ilumatobacteraceae bacterium]